jgi:hypothetical protein
MVMEGRECEYVRVSKAEIAAMRGVDMDIYYRR